MIWHYNGKEKNKFEWDEEKEAINRDKHGVSFALAQYAFADQKRVILKEKVHSENEERYYCLGEVAEGIMSVRFTYRNDVIRIFGAGYWRKGKDISQPSHRIDGFWSYNWK